MATSVTQNSITWTFSADHTVGQYANGDYYVVGPVTITNISPASTTVNGRIVSGSMINPVAAQYPNQGFDAFLSNYQAALNVGRPGGNDLSVGNPLVVANGSSLVTMTSYAAADSRPQFSNGAVLTVVASAPAAGSFRPPYCGTVKNQGWNKSDLNYSILRSLTPNAASPTDMAVVAATMGKTWFEICTSDDGREWHPENNQPGYGRDMANVVGDLILALHLNFTNGQKEQAYVNVVQYGIDVYGAAANGGDWYHNGGFNIGRKPALVLAGLALNSTAILYYANTANFFNPGFQEDQQVFTVQESDVGKVVDDQWISRGRLRLTYTAGMVGLPEWGVTALEDWESSDASNWSAIYRIVNAEPFIICGLAMLLTPGATDAWNNTTFFNYVDRCHHNIGGGIYNSGGMWTAYRASLGSIAPWTVPAPVPTPAIIPVEGDRICLGFSTQVTAGASGYSGIVITASGGGVTITGTPTNGLDEDWPTTLEKAWTLSRVIASGETVTIAYTQPGNGMEDVVGGLDVASFSGIPVVNYSTATGGADTTAPTLVNATVQSSGTTIVLAFDEAVTRTAGTPTVSLTRGACTLTYVSGSGMSAHTYSLSRTVYDDETGTLSATLSSGNWVDAASNSATSISNAAVTNNSVQSDTPTPIPITFTSMTALTIRFQ